MIYVTSHCATIILFLHSYCALFPTLPPAVLLRFTAQHPYASSICPSTLRSSTQPRKCLLALILTLSVSKNHNLLNILRRDGPRSEIDVLPSQLIANQSYLNERGARSSVIRCDADGGGTHVAMLEWRENEKSAVGVNAFGAILLAN